MATFSKKKKLGEFKIGSIFSNPGKRKELEIFFHLRLEQQIEQRYLKRRYCSDDGLVVDVMTSCPVTRGFNS